MKSLNKVSLIGNVTRDPENKFMESGTAFVNFGLATNRVDKQGEEHAEFHRLVAWGKLAEIVTQYVTKGSKLYVEGRLHTRRYTTAEGQEKESTEIVADEVILLDKRSNEPTKGGE